MTAPMTPLVVDCFQGEEVKDWAAVYAFGIRGVIHKSSEGSNFRDKVYAMRKDRARKAGLLYGAYHFLNDTDVEAQVANFLEAAQPDVDLLLALDYEENKNRTGSLEQARRFLEMVFAKTGQRPVLYSGNLIKEQLRKPDAFFNQHRLWLAHYAAVPTLPAGWPHFWLHQYTGDGSGPPPHEVPGIATKGIDLNVFGGEDLASEWAPKGPVIVPSIVTAPPPLEGMGEGEGAAAGMAAAALAPTPTPSPNPSPSRGGEEQSAWMAKFSQRFSDWSSDWAMARVNDLAANGSRIGQGIGSAFSRLWRGRVVKGAVGGAITYVGSTTDTSHGWAKGPYEWAAAHPLLLVLICVVTVALYYEVRHHADLERIRAGFLSAWKDGRYWPRGGTPQQTPLAPGA